MRKRTDYNSVTQKVCTHPDCDLAGTPQPIRNFYSLKRQDGRRIPRAWCQSCVRREELARYRSQPRQFKLSF